MKFSESLKKNTDFRRVYNKGSSHSNNLLVMYVLPNNKEENRVVRHHLTRLIRESYRLHEEMFQYGLDIVVIVRVNAKNATYHQIERALLHLANLHSILI